MVRGLGWGVADQAVSSVTNFAMVLYVAHTVGAAQFGAFSLAYVTYSFALNASRGVSSEPLIVRFSGVDLPTWRLAAANCTGTAAVVGLVTGVGVVGVAIMLSSAARFAFLALGLTLPALLLQDSWRFAFFAARRGGQAFLNDLIWALALLPALKLLRAAGAGNVFWFVFAWGAAAGVAAAAGLLQARVAPKLSGSWAWLSHHRDLGFRYVAENTSNSLAWQLRTYGLGAIAGLAAVGYVQAAGTLLGPVMVVFDPALRSVAYCSAADRRARGADEHRDPHPRRLRRQHLEDAGRQADADPAAVRYHAGRMQVHVKGGDS